MEKNMKNYVCVCICVCIIESLCCTEVATRCKSTIYWKFWNKKTMSQTSKALIRGLLVEGLARNSIGLEQPNTSLEKPNGLGCLTWLCEHLRLCCVNGPSLPTCLVDAPPSSEQWEEVLPRCLPVPGELSAILSNARLGGLVLVSKSVFQAASPKMSGSRARGRREHPLYSH